MFEGKERITFKLSCIDCGMDFIAKSKSALRCPECRKKDNCERSKESQKKSRAKRRVMRLKSPLQQKSIQQVLQELSKYNYEHKAHLTYGQYVQLMEERQ